MAAKTPKLIASGALSALGTPVEVTNLSDYSSLRLTVSNSARGSVQVGPLIETSHDNGSTWSTVYYFSHIYDGAESRSLVATSIQGPLVSTTMGGGSIEIMNFNIAAPTFTYATRSRPDAFSDIVSSMDPIATPCDAIRISATSDSFTAGNWYLTGHRAPLEVLQTIAYPQTGDNVVDVTGYASLNIVVIGGSVGVADLFVGDNGIGTIGDFVINYIDEGTVSTVTRTANESRYWSLQDGLSATSYAACMHLTGVDMAVPTYCPATSQFANGKNRWTSGFRDNAAAITSLTVTDDVLTTGTLYVTGVPN